MNQCFSARLQVVAVFLLCILASSWTQAQIPRTLSYQGVLTDNNGDPRNGTFHITFKLYDVGTGGTPIWTQLDTVITSRGVFSTTLGKSAFSSSLLFDKQYWLGIQVSGEAELIPRVALTSVGYSMNALRADTAGVAIGGDGLWSGNDSSVYLLNRNVGIGTAAPLMTFVLPFSTSLRSQKPMETGVPKGYMVIEGDIIVPENFFEDPRNSAWRQNSFWPNGVVPFVFAGDVTQVHRDSMLAAMREWEVAANVDFVPRNQQTDYLFIQNDTANYSGVGYRFNGNPVVTMGIASWNSRFIMCHELAHCLGIWHEQSRPNRENFVRIETANIIPGQLHNFDRHQDAGQYGPYDFESVMHYEQFAFSRNGQRTITVLPPNEQWQDLIGQRDRLSYLDRTTMSFLYARPNWRFVDGSVGVIGLGWFVAPFGFFTPLIAGYVPEGGTVWIQPGSYSSTGLYTRAVTIRAPLGGVLLGQ